MAKEKRNFMAETKENGKFGWFALLTYIGAAWYFLQVSFGFWGSVLALLKAAVWPVYLLHRVFELLRI